MSIYLQAGYGYEFINGQSSKAAYEEWSNAPASDGIIAKATDAYYGKGPALVVDNEDNWFFFTRFGNLGGFYQGEITGLNAGHFIASDDVVDATDAAFEAFLLDPETPAVFSKRDNWIHRELILSATS